MSSSGERIRLLLDTTYLLPIVGVWVEGVEEALLVLEKLYRSKRLEAFYTPFNLLEMIAKLSKMEVDARRVKLGLRSIRESFRVTHPTPSGYLLALQLRRRGFRDLIDLLLYATARSRGLRLLTRDKSLVSFLEKNGEDLKHVMLEEELVEKYGG